MERNAVFRVVSKILIPPILLFAGTGIVGMMLGGNYLNYSVLAKDPLAGQHWGIFAVELGVGITVASAMVTIFMTFAGRER